MTATAVLEDLARKGVTIWADSNTIRYRGPRGILTPGDVERLRLHKPELLALLRGMHAPPPTDGEMEEIAVRVFREGYVLLYSTVLQDLVAFYCTEADRRKIPPGFVPYSDRELRELFGPGKPPVSPEHLKRVHGVKKELGGVVGERRRCDTAPQGGRAS